MLNIYKRIKNLKGCFIHFRKFGGGCLPKVLPESAPSHALCLANLYFDTNENFANYVLLVKTLHLEKKKKKTVLGQNFVLISYLSHGKFVRAFKRWGSYFVGRS